MKAYNTILLVLAMFFINTMVVSNTTNTNELKIESIGERLNKEELKRPVLEDFLNHMGFLESSNNYRKVNTLGYLGKYQFGKSTLETLGYGDIPTEDFVNSPKLQEKVMIKNLKYNKKVLVNYIEIYNGECVGGVIITESGLLGAAHLAGPGGVKKFLRRGHDPKDSYGTKLSEYLIRFSNYDLNLD
jgi:hypothetical protein